MVLFAIRQSESAGSPSSTPAGAKIGSPAPDIRGTTLDGAAFDLAALRGRPVIVNFWGSWCVPCRDEFPLFQAAEKAHADAGLAIVGVLFRDSPDAARAFVRQYAADWPTVTDPDGSTARLYQIPAAPTTYFIDRSGVLRKIQYGELSKDLLDPLLASILG